MDSELTLIEVDERGRTSLGRLRPAPGRYLGEVQSDGTVVLHPATVTTAGQAKLLARPDVMAAIDELASDPTTGIRRGRPSRRTAR
ncbi:MAG TPA: hypothetical protein VG708_10800 [Mycobacteriales bacterium]|nr:hypothetical protein [Mycobacteriales bacterium]